MTYPADAKRELKIPCVTVAMLANRFVDDAVVAKRFVVVAFASVVLPLTLKLVDVAFVVVAFVAIRLVKIDDALDELPEDQRWVFVQHELEGRSFKELADETGDPINTLLSRKRYAVLHLRERLQELYDSIESF